MADFPAMPLWTDAYIADTRHLSDAEHGRYLLMLMDMWRSPGCRFPNDRAWLERRFRRTPEQFDSDIQPLLDEFCQCDGNWWTQKKLQKVWKQVRETSLKQSGRAKSLKNRVNGTSRGLATKTKTKTKTLNNPPIDTPPQQFELEGPVNGSGTKPADKPGRKKPAIPLPEDWRPDVTYARQQGLSDREINHQANKFSAYCKANDKRYSNHTAAWHNWVLTYLERSRN